MMPGSELAQYATTDSWRTFRYHLGTGPFEVYDAELLAIGHAHRQSVMNRATLQTHRVTKLAVFSDLHAVIR